VIAFHQAIERQLLKNPLMFSPVASVNQAHRLAFTFSKTLSESSV